MKNISGFALVAGILALAVSCASPSSSTPATVTNAAKVTAVTPLTPASLTASGATTSPSDLASTKTLVTNIVSSSGTATELTKVLNDIQTILSNPSGSVSSPVLARSVSSALQTSITNFENAYKNFPTTKTATFSTDLSSESFGTYLAVTKAQATVTVTAATLDGAAVANDYSNLKSLSASALGVFDANAVGLLTVGGPVKDFKLRANVGADGSETINKTTSQVTFSLNYKASASLALSVNSGTVGGKIILTFNAANNNTKTYSATALTSTVLLADFVPTSSSSLTLDVYDDGGTLKFTKAYTDVNALLADFQ